MESLDHLLNKLAAFESAESPVVSLYLDLQSNDHGRPNFEPFVRKEFKTRAQTFADGSPERESFERDVERINNYLEDELQPSAKGLAIFACAGADEFFEAVQLDAPVERHRLIVSSQPDIYPLVRLNDQYPRYAALLVDTNAARLFVFGLGARVAEREINNVKTNRTSVGGWSQARYQRHNENYHLHHAKEVVEALDRVVREEEVGRIVISGDEVIIPLLREQLPQHLAEKVVDILHLDIKTPEHEVLQATLETMREHDARDDAEKVGRVLGEYRAGGLAVVGARDTLTALEIGQVDELIISASRDAIKPDAEDRPEGAPASLSGEVGDAIIDAAAAEGDLRPEALTDSVTLADELVTKAQQTAARVTFIEDASLLAGVGGVGALLRYRI